MKKFSLFLMFILLCPAFTATAKWKTVGQPLRLIGGEAGYHYMRPLWSPDGSLIAFTDLKYNGLHVMNADGTGDRQISDEPAAGFGFEWSSDSRAIVSRVAKFEGKYRYNAVKVFDLNTNESRLISDYRTMMPGLPHWADADQKIYMHNGRKLEIFHSGKKTTALKKQNDIYFLKNDRIAVGDVEDQKYRVLEPLQGERCLNMLVSPDRSKITFEVVGGNLYVMKTDGSGLTDLGRGHRPQWGPDSRHLVYMVTEDDGYRYLSSDIIIIQSDGSNKTKLQFEDDRLEMNPSWSPDGEKIAFDIPDEGAIYVVKITESMTE